MSKIKEIKERDRLSEKKRAVVDKKSGNRIGVAVAISVFLLVSGIYFAFFHSSEGSAGSESISSAPKAAGGSIVFRLALFEDGTARHFRHEDGNLTIKFFVLKSADGVIRAAFDACDVCWRSGKGYFQEGDNMVCRNCGQKFASNRINEVKGGCNPAPLDREIVGGNVVIRARDILDGKQYFNFPGKA